MTVTVPVIYRAGTIQTLEPVTLPENQRMEATLVYDVVAPLDVDTRTVEERLASFDAMIAHFRSLNLPSLPPEALERESFYED